jgi:hypothetical protein
LGFGEKMHFYIGMGEISSKKKRFGVDGKKTA